MLSKRFFIAFAFVTVGCGGNEASSGLKDFQSFSQGVPSSFAADVSSYQIAKYEVSGGNIKNLVKAQDLLAISIKDIQLVANGMGTLTYAEGAQEFGVISAALLEFIDHNEGYGEDGDMRCGDVGQGFDVRTSLLLAKLYQELSNDNGSDHFKKFWEDGFYIARAWKKRLCGDKYQEMYWESSSDRHSGRDDSSNIVAPGTAVSKDEKTSYPDSSSSSSSAPSSSANDPWNSNARDTAPVYVEDNLSHEATW